MARKLHGNINKKTMRALAIPFGVLLTAGVAASCSSDSDDDLAGAALLSAGNIDSSYTGPFSLLDSDELSDGTQATLDDLPIAAARQVTVHRNQYLVTISDHWGHYMVPDSHGYFFDVEGTVDSPAVRLRSALPEYLWTTPFAFSPDSESSIRGTRHLHQGVMRVEGHEESVNFDYPFPISAIELINDTSLLMSPRGEGRIDQIDASNVWELNHSNQPDELLETLIGQPGDDDAIYQAEESFGEVVAIVPLPDNQLAFAATESGLLEAYTETDDIRIWHFDGQVVEPFTTHDFNPVHATPVRYSGEGYVIDLQVDPLAPGPDGTVLAISNRGPSDHLDALLDGRSRDDWWPTISTVDLTTGEVTPVISLEGVTPNDTQPISAATIDDDLVFLAEGKLWLLEDAFA